MTVRIQQCLATLGAAFLLLTLSACGSRQNPLPEHSSGSPEEEAPLRSSAALSSRHSAAATAGAQATATGTTASLAALPAPQLEVLGRVQLQETGAPAEGAALWLSPASGEPVSLAATKTDPAGQFRLRTPLPETPVVLYASAPGYAVEGMALPDESTTSPASGDRLVRMDFSLQRASFLRGKVTDAAGQPLSGARVQLARLSFQGGDRSAPVPPSEASLQTWETVAAEDGQFAFEGIPAGSLDVEVTRPGYVTEKRSVEPPAESLVFALSRNGVGLGGHVFEQATGVGVKGADVRLTEVSPSPSAAARARSWTATSDELGAFSFSGLSEGNYRISGRKDDLILRSKDPLLAGQVTLAAGETTPELTLLLYPGYTITGRVTDQKSKQPLEGVEVSTAGEQAKTARTDADGRYRLPGLAPGANGLWTALRFRKEGYASAQENLDASILIRLDSGEGDVTQDMEMVPVVTISGRVMTADGNGVAGAVVQPRQTSGLQTHSDGAGNYELLVPAPAMFTLAARSEEYGIGRSTPVRVDRESTSGIDIIVDRPTSVRGTIVDEQGKPVSKAFAEAMFDGELLAHELTETSGEFQFAGLPAGVLKLSARPQTPDLAKSLPVELTLAPGETRGDVRLTLRSSRLLAAGTVVDEEGKPVSGLSVQVKTGSEGDDMAYGSTDEQGRFLVKGAAGETVEVRASGMNYEDLVEKNVATSRDDLRLVVRKPRPVLFVGSVVDAVTSEPVAQFDILDPPSGNLLPPGIRIGNVEFGRPGPGVFTISGAKSGDSYRLFLRAPGYAPFDSGMRQVPYGDKAPENGTVEATFALKPL